jgi:hypothetical protein
VVITVVVWTVLLGAGAGWALARGGPTAREQTTVADALPVVDRAAAQIASAASVDGQAVAAISGFDRVGDCAITIFRGGERYQRTVTVVVTPGTEGALMRRVSDRLPAGYGARLSTAGPPKLVADAGLWVRLSASVIGKGQVQFVADTGACRPLGNLPATGDAAVGDPAGADRTEDAGVLTRLGLAASQWHVYRANCPNGGEISTVEAIGADGAEPGALNEILHGLGTPVVSSPDAYAYTAGPRHVAVRADTNHVVVTSTLGCP